MAALSAALADVMESADARTRLAERGSLYVRSFAAETVAGDYDALFRDLQRIAA